MKSLLQKIKENKAIWLLSLAILCILAGYACTSFWGIKTTLHLRQERAFVSHSELPFHLQMDSCHISPYAIGNVPSNIQIFIHLQDQNLKEYTFQISLNEMGRYGHYKFFLKAYDKDLKGCTLLVTHDPIGTGLVYVGYLLFALFIIFILLFKNVIFRKLERNLSLFLLIIAPSVDATAAVPLNDEEVAAFGQLSIAYNGRIAPFDSYARDYCEATQLSGPFKHLFDPQFATRTVLSVYFYPEEHPNLPRPQMRIFPQGKVWLNPEEPCKNSTDSQFIAHILQLLKLEECTMYNVQCSINNENTETCGDFTTWHLQKHNESIKIIKGIEKFQQLRCAEGSIDVQRQKVEIWYNKFCIPLLTIVVLFISSICYSITFIIHKRRKQNQEKHYWFQPALLIITLFCLLIDFFARFYITRHLPLHNTYDTLICLSFFALLIGILAEKRMVFLTLLSLLTSCTTAFIALMMGGQSFSSVSTALVSPWLGIHVSIVMLAYTLLFIGFSISIISIFSIIIKKNTIDFQRLNNLNQVVNILGTCFLAIGIMLGSVWANYSWGSYWSWDPKETMALLTLIAYSFSLVACHTKIGHKPIFYPILNLLAFGILLCAYFGVSAWFGGMHANY